MTIDIFLQVLSKPDSTIISDISKLSEQVETISKKVTVSPWIPIIAATVGGLLVWVGQYLDRRAKRKQEAINCLHDLVTKSEMLSVNIKNALKELSTQKNLRAYWWYCYFDEYSAGADKDIENEIKYLSNHHSACDALIKCSLKIGELLAEYYSNVSKFKLLTKENFDTIFIIKLITDYDFSNAKDISVGVNNEEALSEYENNCKELAKEYYLQFESLEILNETLKTNISKI
ncbi:MAG: hypothetical protein M3Z26_13120 [Bacteroidota bacterium]|nr:hypothetical protein [Bacteroidota bacterium]